MLKVKVRFVGSSLIISLPAQVMRAFDVKSGDYLEFKITGNGTFELVKINE